MSNQTQSQSAPAISATIISPDGQPHAFHRINVEYFALYHDLSNKELSKAVEQGLKLGFLFTTKQRENAMQWRSSYNKSFKALCDTIVSDIKQLGTKLPLDSLRRLSSSTTELKKQLIDKPNDYLRHFHIAWLYQLKNDLRQADLHFNIAALQSQKDNKELACFALRHLADIRYRTQRYPQALIAIKTAKALTSTYDAELHFEYVRMLTMAARTSESLKQLTILISKAPKYENLALIESDFERNPTFKRYFATQSQRHIQNVLELLDKQWENDPLNLLDLDKELGTANSLETLKQKQINTVKELPELLLSDEQSSAQLIQQQSRKFILNALDVRNQYFIQDIEQHQYRASRVHKAGQWLIYTGIVAIIALVCSHAISAISQTLNHTLVVNGSVQMIVLTVIAALVLIGMVLLHFTPTKLKTLLKKKQQLEHLSSKLGISA